MQLLTVLRPCDEALAARAVTGSLDSAMSSLVPSESRSLGLAASGAPHRALPRMRSESGVL